MPAKSPALGTTFASMAAGPTFVTAIMLQSLYLSVPDPIVVSTDDVIMFAIALVVSFFFGFLLAFVPNLIGALAMAGLAEKYAVARLPGVWMFAGAVSAAPLAFLYRADALIIFPFAATGALCAGICRAFALDDGRRPVSSGSASP